MRLVTEQYSDLPPCDIEAEQAIIAIVLSDDAAMAKAAGRLSPRDFYRRSHAIIFETAAALQSGGETVTPLNVQAALNKSGKLSEVGGIVAITDLVMHYSGSASLDYQIGMVIEQSQKRSLMRFAREATDHVNDSSASQILTKLQSQLLEISGRGRTRTSTDLSDLSRYCFDEIERRSELKGLPGITTGYQALDDATGGFEPETLTILAGRTSMGKTRFLLNLMVNALRDKHSVALFSIEMSKDQIVRRLFSLRTHIDSQKIRYAKNLNQSDWCALTRAIDWSEFGKCDIFDVKDEIGTASSIDAALLRMIAEGRKPDLVFIDHLHEMQPDETQTYKNKNDLWDAITLQLRRTAQRLQLPVVLLCQLSRAPEARNDKRPVKSDLRESGAIEQRADVIMMLYRDKYYNPETLANTELEVVLAKVRDGATGSVFLSYSESTGLIGSMPDGYESPARVRQEPPGRYAGSKSNHKHYEGESKDA